MVVGLGEHGDPGRGSAVAVERAAHQRRHVVGVGPELEHEPPVGHRLRDSLGRAGGQHRQPVRVEHAGHRDGRGREAAADHTGHLGVDELLGDRGGGRRVAVVVPDDDLYPADGTRDGDAVGVERVLCDL